MRRATLALCLLLPVPALCGAARPVATRATAPAQDVNTFRQDFRQAMKINAKDEMRKLMRTHFDWSVEWILATAEAISVQPNDALYADMNALRDTWNAEMKTQFVDKMERYFSLLSGTTKRDRATAKSDFDRQVLKFHSAREAGKPEGFGPVGLEFEGLAGVFKTLGDVYYESQCWLFVGQCFDEQYRKDDADLDKAATAYSKVIATRDEVGLKDRYYKETRERLNHLVGLGFGPKEPAPGVDPGVAPAQPGAPVTAEMQFELALPGKVQRPNFFLDDHYQIWHSINLGATGSSTSIVRLGNGPMALRPASAKAMVDVDGDGTGDVEIPLRGGTEAVEFEIGEGDARRKWAFVARVGIQEDQYQGIQSNLSPQDDRIGIYVAPAGSMVGSVNGVSVQVIDENMNGVYGDTPQSWGHLGLLEGTFQPELDSVVVGDEKRAQPWSEFLHIGDAWYQMAVEQGGKKLVATPTPIPTGSLSLKAKGVDFEALVLKGSGRFENTYVELAGGGSVELPVGRWELHYGIVGKGKKMQRVKALVLPGSKTRWDVTADSKGNVELGAPFDMEWEHDLDGDQLTVVGGSVIVTGAAGERYERLYGCVLRPEVSYRKAGSKRGSKAEKMAVVGGSDEITKYGWGAAWFPLDLTLTVSGHEEGLEVQLVEKKNKLFGKVESSWR